MQKLAQVLVLFSILIMAASSLRAGPAVYFDFDEEALKGALRKPRAVEAFLGHHPGCTFRGLPSHLRKAVSAEPDMYEKSSGPIGDLPAWLWGCVLGEAGFVLVMLNSSDSKEGLAAGLGCLLQKLLIIGFILSTIPSSG
jgi:hypothetical protein